MLELGALIFCVFSPDGPHSFDTVWVPAGRFPVAFDAELIELSETWNWWSVDGRRLAQPLRR